MPLVPETALDLNTFAAQPSSRASLLDDGLVSPHDLVVPLFPKIEKNERVNSALNICKEDYIMAWDFETEPEFQKELDWIDAFVREEVEPLDHVLGNPYDIHNPRNQKLVRPLQAEVKKRKLWACHLGPELGGPGYGQLKLALMNEILGRARSAPTVFGCQAPDTGNAEILAHYGTSEQKKKYLEPLLNNTIVSCFSMTEPHAGADPKMFKCRAMLDGDFWVINGEKWFSSNARFASFLIAMVVTDPDAPPYQKMSMFLVPSDTPGINIIRNVGLGTEREEGEHAYIRYEDVRVPRENLLGQRG